MKFVSFLIVVLLFSNTVISQKSVDQRVKVIEDVVKKGFSNNPNMAKDIHSIIIYKNNKELYASYYNGFNSDSLNNLKSITKSIISLLVGIAVDKGYIKDLQQPAISYFDECKLDANTITSKKNITIENLLLMKSGIKWDNRALIKDDWWYNKSPHCFFLKEFPMEVKPGTKFSYNSAVAHLTSGIVSRATGESTLNFAKKNLFIPLGIHNVAWGQDGAGEYYGNSELSLLPKDLLTIGKMLLNNGIYKGKRILSKSWIKKMTTKAYDATSFMNYGYMWMTSKTKDPYFFFAGGSGGQHLFIVPEKNIVAVTTGHWNNARSTIEIMQLASKIIKQL